MLDSPVLGQDVLAALRDRLGSASPNLPTIFQAGDLIAEATADPATLPPGIPTQRIAVTGAVTIDYLRRAVACAVVREGVLPVLYQGLYGAYVQEILDPGSALNAFAPELVVIATHWRDLVVEVPIGASRAEVDSALAPKCQLFATLWQRLAGQGAKVIQHLPAPPPHRYRGVADRLAPASPANQIARLTDMLLEAGRGLVTWVDMAALAIETGSRRFAPAKFYYAAKLEHDQKFLPDYLPAFQAAWRSAHARAKKVLVLDLDNTLWGGVIGDDGVDGIKLGADSPSGEAFAAWQAYVKALGERGIILAVCSKNDPAIAETGFAHPDAALKRADFAAFECSWGDKANGLRRIAASLNVGLDSFVFCDDNPAECDLVRQELPEVTVICMGADPASFIDLFDAGHWFDADGYTQEDLGRSAAYAARAAALADRDQATDLGGYLAGLGMTATIGRPAEADIARVAQLELKTNQFNTTTSRYSEAQIRGFLDREDAVVLAFRLSDRFGDHGLTSTLIAVREGDALRIASWLMSCRVFSRTAEAFIMRELQEIAASMGVRRMIADYRPTAKNAVVADLYPRLGFAELASGLFGRSVDRGTGDLVTYIVKA